MPISSKEIPAAVSNLFLAVFAAWPRLVVSVKYQA
jgi:hypothetical protein